MNQVKLRLFYLPLVIYTIVGVLLLIGASFVRVEHEIQVAENKYISDLKKNGSEISSVLTNLLQTNKTLISKLPFSGIQDFRAMDQETIQDIRTQFREMAQNDLDQTQGLKSIRIIDRTGNPVLEYPPGNYPEEIVYPLDSLEGQFSIQTIFEPENDLVYVQKITNNQIIEVSWDTSILKNENMLNQKHGFAGLWIVNTSTVVPHSISLIHPEKTVSISESQVKESIEECRSGENAPLTTVFTTDQTPYIVGFLRLPESNLGVASLKRKDIILNAMPRNVAMISGSYFLIFLIGFVFLFRILRSNFSTIESDSSDIKDTLLNTQLELEKSAVGRDFYLVNTEEMITHHERNGKLVYASPAAKKMFTFESPDTDDLDYFKCVHPDDLQDVLDFWHRLDFEQNTLLQYRMIDRMDTVCWIESSFKPITVDQLDGEVICFSRNITHYIQSEQALSESEFRYRSVLELAPMGIFQSRIDGTILFINPTMANMFQFDSPREMMAEIDNHGIGKVIYSKAEDRNPIIKTLMESVKEWHRFKVELKRRDQSRFKAVMSLVAEPSIKTGELEIFGFIEEVETSDRSALQLSENRFRRLFSESPFAMLLLTQNLELQDYNDAFRNILGLASGVNLEADYFQKDPNFQMIQNTILSTRDSADISFQYDFDLIHKEAIFDTNRKETMDLEITIIRLQNRAEDFNLSGYAILLQDVTDKKQIQNQLIQAQKMEAVGRLAGGVAHDFNNLLQVVIGYGEIILQDVIDDESRENLTYMMEASQRGMVLVRQLLAFSRREELKLQPLDMNNLVANLLKMLRRLIGEHISLKFTQTSNLPFVHADPGQLEQVIMNLCVNARDAMPDGGKIKISTHLIEPSENWSELHTTIPQNTYVVVTVTDDGPGIPADIQYRVFEPFFTTKKADSGTGLGLATVYSVVKRHKGYLLLDSEPGHGAAFSIYLPLSEITADEYPSDDEITTGPANESRGVILLAEDEERVRGLLKQILETAGYTVITANNGMEAVTQFHLNSHRVDLLMLDVIMPGMNGKDVYDFIALSNPKIPVLFSSGYSHDLLQNDYMLKIPGKLIQKPYQRQELLRTINELITCRT